jgi:pimeloyl-ACP methyl ester carboxylesterase
MCVQRFGAQVTVDSGGRGVIAIPFDPDQVWGAKAEHPVGGTIDGCGVRGRITRGSGGWVFTVTPMWMRDAGVAAGEVIAELAPEGPQRGDLADDIEDQFRAALERLAAEPWYPAALAALERIMAGDRSMEAFRASRPLYYGSWGEAAQAHATVGVAERHQAAREGFFAGAAIDAPATRTALNKLTAPVLLHAGELDPLVTPAMVRQAAPLFNDATVVVQPGAAHYPWIDDRVAFATAISSFLG